MWIGNLTLVWFAMHVFPGDNHVFGVVVWCHLGLRLPVDVLTGWLMCLHSSVTFQVPTADNPGIYHGL